MGKATLFLLLCVSVSVGQVYSPWGKVDTLTSGDFDDFNPRVAHNNPMYPAGSIPTWVVFERQDNKGSSISAVKYLGSQTRWDPNVYTVSPESAGVMQRLPDVCTVFGEVLVDSVYKIKSFTLAAWQVRSDSVWNIYYSKCAGDSSNWSAPTSLTQDSVNNENPEVRGLTDTSIVIIWRRDSSLQYSVASESGVSQPKRLFNSNFDSTQFDFDFAVAQQSLVWTNKDPNGNTYCIFGNVQLKDSLTVSATDTIKLDGDIEDPQFMVSYYPTLTFDLRDSGRYEAWMASYGGYSAAWQADLAAGDSISDNLNLVSYLPPFVGINQHGFQKNTQSALLGFAVWERIAGSDTSLVFGLGATSVDTIGTPGNNQNPSISRSICGFSGNNAVGLAVFQSNRTGQSHIYARSFFFTIGAVDEPPHSASGFTLNQNYPNPFNPTTTISYWLSAFSRVAITVYDVLGRKVKTLVDARQSPGEHSVVFDSRGLASGVYFCRLSAGSYVAVKKMALLK